MSIFYEIEFAKYILPYLDESLDSPLKSKTQIASGSSLYVVDVSHDAASLHQLMVPSSENKAGIGYDEICIDLSNVTKNDITNLGSAFLGNSNLESADLSGFCDIDTIYSLFAYCTSLKCVYFDTLCNVGKGDSIRIIPFRPARIWNTSSWTM